MSDRAGRRPGFLAHLLQIGILAIAACATSSAQNSVPVVTGDARVDKLLSQMTLEEKMALIRGAREHDGESAEQ